MSALGGKADIADVFLRQPVLADRANFGTGGSI